MQHSIYEKVNILKSNCPNALTLLVLNSISDKLENNQNLLSKDLKFIEDYWNLVSVNYSTRPIFAKRRRTLQK